MIEIEIGIENGIEKKETVPTPRDSKKTISRYIGLALPDDELQVDMNRFNDRS
jgi:hypothetical protein